MCVSFATGFFAATFAGAFLAGAFFAAGFFAAGLADALAGAADFAGVDAAFSAGAGSAITFAGISPLVCSLILLSPESY
jgi:hypothetical protein